MPMVIPVAVQVGALLLEASTMLAAGLAFVASIGVAAYQKRRAAQKAKDAWNNALQDRLVMITMADMARSRVYGGPVRNVEGVLFKGTWGPKKEYFSMVVGLAGHRCQEIVNIYANDQKLEFNGELVSTAPYGVMERESGRVSVTGIGPQSVVLPHTPIGGTIEVIDADSETRISFGVSGGNTVSFDLGAISRTASVTYQHDEAKSYMRVYKFLGGSQTLAPMLAERFGSMIWDTDRFDGICCLIVDLAWKDSAYPSGIPSFSADLLGANDILDPRTGAYGFSRNPALCSRDWALFPYGGGIEAGDLVGSSFITAANGCDTPHTYTDSAGNSVTRPLYTCAYVAKTGEDATPHFAELVEAMGGKYGWSGGRLKVRAGVWSAPVATLDDSMLSDKEARAVITGTSVQDLINVFRGSIADQSQAGQVVQLPELRAEAYIAQDGRELVSETTLAAVSFAPQALHIMGTQMRDVRQGLYVTWPANMKAYGLQILDTIYVISPRYGWTDVLLKTFEVLQVRFSLTNGPVLELKETHPSIMQPDAVFSALDPSPNTALPKPWIVQTVTGLEAVSGTSELLKQSDGSIVSRTKLTFNPITDAPVLNGGLLEVAWSDSNGVWESREFPGDSGVIWLTGLQDGRWYQFKMRAKTRLAEGNWSMQITRLIRGKSEPPPLPDSFTIRTMPDGTRVLEGGYTAATRPIDLAGYRIRYRQGSGPYELSEMQPFQTDDGFFTALPIETNLLMAGTYTLALVGVDTSRNESAPLFIMAVLPNPRLGDAVAYRILQSEGWPGTRNDCVLDVDGVDVVLRAREQAVWDDFTGPWDSYTRWVWHPVSIWNYIVSDDDFGASVSVLPIVSFDGVGDVEVAEQHSDDAVVWSSWAPIAASIVARYVRVRVTVSAIGATGPGLTQLTYLRALSVIYTGNATVETVNDLDPLTLPGAQRLAPGDYLLPTSREFLTVTELAVTLQGVGGNWSWSIVAGERNAKHIRVYSGGALADPPLLDYSVRGIAL